MNLKEDCFKASCWNGEVCLNGDDGIEALFIDEKTARRCLRIVRCSILVYVIVIEIREEKKSRWSRD